MVKEGAVVIDVGTTRVPERTEKSGFKLTGDVKFDEVAPKCSFITPSTWWCRSHDHCLFNEEYIVGRQESYFINNKDDESAHLLYLSTI